MDNAENLAGITILQCVEEGAPVIYGGESPPADMRSGTVDYNAPEYPLTSAGISQLADFYDLPCYSAGYGLGKIPKNMNDLMSGALKFVLIYSNLCDIIAGFGELENAESMSLDQVVLDVEAIEQAKPYLKNVQVNEDTLAFDAIKKVGPGGSFLDLKHTLEHFREEVWLEEGSIILSKGDESVRERAKQKVNEVLETHEPEPLDEDVEKEIDNILKKCEKKMV
ncbi:hypothetical protein AKJ50_02020 [candidate division MSBL1 archaeon SCGC-AAA382A13]|uniref:Trimethylamine:corrinoid methyltransferase n=1 Tax=candidate division MSBL1 archaeon SCGC-AAA382A13 TaxID=1698279 RepID=A0A133VEE1_9EURY|nr:hypothetical protein AKJ50_02020 [candidate division MSBL1 archaeon SCGC-AAA382A13]